ncbi:aprataxin-like protein [Pestalotiopsis sp. IQ-011]
MDFLQRLARYIDRPLFPWKKVIIGFSLGQYLFEEFLSYRQYQVLKKSKPPKVLEAEITQETYDKSQEYGRAKAKFGFIKGIYGQIQNIAFIHFDVLPKLWSWTGQLLLNIAPARFTGEISHSIVFILSFIMIQQVLSLPTSIYHTFVLEEKFGFNKQTPKLFITDMIKSNILAFVLAPPILAGFLSIVKKTGNQFFFYLWVFVAGLQVFMITVYPIAILPLFNKLSPLEEGKLKDNVEGLAKKLKFPLHELFVIDGSKRSAHSNAYFFGLPWKKHIVIYDTLIEKSKEEEVTAVLAHELGHWSLGHTTSLFGISQAHVLYIFTLFSVFINNASLYADFGFVLERPIIIGFLLFSDALAPMDLIIKLGMNIISRKFEFQADDFARNLGYKKELAASLIKLQVQNLSTMDADWMYASYHFSHPILSERLKALDWVPSEKVAEDKPEAEKASAEADTRLIELEPAPDASSPLRCRIADLCLSSEDLIEYEALSYTWGAPDFTETLHVIKDEDETSVIKITTNLRNALQRIRLKNRKRLLWVDAVCINQQDDSDKSKQIPAMAHIFSAASRVLVWLGTSPRGQMALADIKKVLRFRSTGSKKREAHFSNLESPLNDLVVLPWFRRRWIIQEVVLAADVTVMCGREEISLVHLFRALSDFMRESRVPPVLAPLAAISRLWKTWVLDSNPESGLRLSELLLLFHESDCQVDLDRIYALCNLASDCVVVDKEGEVETDKISVLVDYSQTAECLYQSVVDQILRLEAHDYEITEDVRGHYEVRGPDVETYREVFGAIVERCDGSSRNVTAWVPDWRLPKRREPIFESLDFHFDVYEKRELFSSLIHPVGKSSYNRLKVVNSVLRPFPEHPNMAEVKN